MAQTGLKAVTGVASVARVFQRPANLAALEASLAALSTRFPGAHLLRYLDKVPTVAEGSTVFPTATLVGDVRLDAGVSIWFGSVLRADINKIIVGASSNIQDGSVVHVGDNNGCTVGQQTVVGHRVVLHGCTIGDGCIVGMQATVLDGAVVGDGSVVAAGCVIGPGKVIPPRSLVAGVPGKIIKTLSEEDEAFARGLSGKYERLWHNYLHG